MRRERGFTLVEVLLVVAIIGVLAALAVTSMDPRPRADDASQVVAQLAREASREAVSRGAVRADVAESIGTARSRLLIEADGTIVTVTVEILVEEDPPSDDGSWVEVGKRSVDGVTIGGHTMHAELTDGVIAENTGYTAPIEMLCTNDGTCSGLTVYFEGHASERSRVVIMPLGGEAKTFYAW